MLGRWLLAVLWGVGYALLTTVAQAQPKVEDAVRSGAARTGAAPELYWAEVAAAPRPARTPASLASLYQLCGAPHEGLVRVARQLARTVATGGRPDGGAALSQRVRAAGVPHLGARAWVLSGEHDAPVVRRRLQRWLRGASTPATLRQCGLVRRGSGTSQLVAVVTTEALASLRPFPVRTAPYRWQQLDARVRLPLQGAQVILLGPGAPPHRVPASVAGGRVRARFRLDRPGRWQIQLVGELEQGPRPLLAIESYVDAKPPRHLAHTAPPQLLNEQALLRSINERRRRAGRPPLRGLTVLTQLAGEHAAAMRDRRQVAHDVGRGPPDRRAELAGLDGRRLGENVARALSLGGLLQAWWDSPSHRENLLDPRYRTAGLGVARDRRGRFYGALLLMR